MKWKTVEGEEISSDEVLKHFDMYDIMYLKKACEIINILKKHSTELEPDKVLKIVNALLRYEI